MNTLLTKSVVDADGPCHALLTLDSWEYLRRVLECYGTLSKRVANSEEVHEARGL